jgi:trimeric autotransporter adhesin
MVAIAAVVIGVGTGVGVASAQASSGPDYRTSVATTGSATRTLTVSGTIEPFNQTQASFQVAGTVAAVNVAVGQHVTAGQTLATLDISSLQELVSMAQASLDGAQAKLSQDESGESLSSSNASSSSTLSSTQSSSQTQTASAGTSGATIVLTAASTPSGSGFPSGSAQPSGSTGQSTTGAGGLQQAQQAEVSAQHTTDLDLQSAAAALSTAERTCAASGGSAPSSPTDGTHHASTTAAYSFLLTSTSDTSASDTSMSDTSTSDTTSPTSTTPTTTPSTATPTSTTPTTTPSTTPPTTTTPTTAPPTTTPPTTKPTTTPASGTQSSGNSSACAQALQTAMADQQQVSRDQQSVQSAETALAQILSSESSTSTKTGTSSGATKSPSSGDLSGGSKGGLSNGGNGSPSGTSKVCGSSTGSSSTPTGAATNSAAQLASDQASIDSDQANLVSAQQSLDNGTLKATMSGTVAAVGLSAGQSLSAGSTSAAITITDPGSYQANASLTSSQVGEVVTGDSVEVTIDGQSGSFRGTVTRVGPVSSGSSGYTYPLVVALANGSLAPNTTVAGSTAQVAVSTAQASHTVVVPTSAVHIASAGTAYVMTVRSGRETRTNVKLGVVGDLYTQITSGLSAGAEVVLADKSQPVPSSSSNSTSTSRRLGGTGAFPAGFPTGGAGFARSSAG